MSALKKRRAGRWFLSGECSDAVMDSLIEELHALQHDIEDEKEKHMSALTPGSPVIHRLYGRRMTVKSVQGSGFVLCCWMGTDNFGNRVELSAAYAWQDLREPTPEDDLVPALAKAAELVGDTSSAMNPVGHVPQEVVDASTSVRKKGR